MSKLLTVFNKIQKKIECSKSISDLEKIRIKYLGRKGFFAMQFKAIKMLELNKKKKASMVLNNISKKVYELFIQHKNKLKDIQLDKNLLDQKIDVSLPGRRIEPGCMHPITLTIDKVESFFCKLGFTIMLGPEIENEYYNFDALNISKYHPSRESHDTFTFNNGLLLRTQTSNMQIRSMENLSPPFRIIVPGKVYRYDYDNTHTPMFHQIEGLIVDTNVTFSHLKWIMFSFLKKFFSKKILIRFRNSYFPFTVPSAEIDIKRSANSKWIEVLGCGMVHPNVLKKTNINYKKYVACAFGIGIERIAMLKHKIDDLRFFFENDLRFIKQFK